MAYSHAAYRQLLTQGAYDSFAQNYYGGDDPAHTLLAFASHAYTNSDDPNIDWTGENGYPGAPRPETTGNQILGTTIGKNPNSITHNIPGQPPIDTTSPPWWISMFTGDANAPNPNTGQYPWDPRINRAIIIIGGLILFAVAAGSIFKENQQLFTPTAIGR